MKKIVCFIESLDSGGAERQMCSLAVLLSECGYDVELWTYYPNNFYLSILNGSAVKYRCIEETQNRFKRIPVLLKEFKKSSPHTVISYMANANIIMCIIKMLGGNFRLVVSDRAVDKVFTLKKKIKFLLYNFATYVVPNSNAQAQVIENNFSFLRKKIRCITNVVDTEKFSAVDNVRRINSETRILTVGRIVPQKNLLRYIAAVRKVIDKGYNLRISWFGKAKDPNYFNLCNEEIKRNKLENNFVFEGVSDDITKQYLSHDLFCLPSVNEGFPNVVCEAMCCGMPIICSNICDNPFIVEEGVSGFLFDPLSVDEISNAIIRFINLSDNDKKDMGIYNSEVSQKKFSKDTFVEKYKKLIEE